MTNASITNNAPAMAPMPGNGFGGLQHSACESLSPALSERNA